MVRDNILEQFYKGVPGASIARLLGCSASHVSKTLREKIKKEEFYEVPRLEQIKAIEKKLFKTIEQYEASKDYKLIDKIKSLQNTYSTFAI